MTDDPYYFLVSEQMGFEGRTTSILIAEAPSETRVKQEFFEQFGKTALDSAELYTREVFLERCSTNLVPWVVDNLENSQRLQPSEFSFTLQIHSKFG